MDGTVDPLAVLREACAAIGSQAAWARKVGIHETQVCAILRGRRVIDASTLAALGLVREVTGGGYAYRRAA